MWQAVKVLPWIGEKYCTPELFPYRTIIIGESNYTTPDKFNPQLVIECVKCHIGENDDPNFSRFATKTRQLMSADGAIPSREEFWRNVAFYNFIQCLVGDKARQRPTPEMWCESVPAFRDIVDLLEPSRLLVLGKANWTNLLSHVEHVTIDGYTARLRCDEREVVAGYTNHPSSAIAYQTWRPIVRRILFEET